MSKWIVAMLMLMLMPASAHAHSGHGHIEASSIWHWLLEVDHIGLVVPIVIVMFMLARSVLRKRNR